MNDSKKQHRITRRDLQELIFTARVQVVADSVLLPLETFFSLIKTAKKVSLKATAKEINNKCINPSKRLILENNKKKEGKKKENMHTSLQATAPHNYHQYSSSYLQLINHIQLYLQHIVRTRIF